MTTYRIRPEWQGLVLERRVWPSNWTITLDTTRPLTQEDLENYWRFDEFKECIEQIEYRDYQGVLPGFRAIRVPDVPFEVEDPRKKRSRNAKK